MITEENWKQLVNNLFEKYFDTNIYELKQSNNSNSLFFRYKDSRVLGFNSITWNKKNKMPYLTLTDEYNYIYIVDDIHLEEVIKYIFKKEEEDKQKKIIKKYDSNLGLQRDLKITYILED